MNQEFLQTSKDGFFAVSAAPSATGGTVVMEHQQVNIYPLQHDEQLSNRTQISKGVQ